MPRWASQLSGARHSMVWPLMSNSRSCRAGQTPRAAQSCLAPLYAHAQRPCVPHHFTPIAALVAQHAVGTPPCRPQPPHAQEMLASRLIALFRFQIMGLRKIDEVMSSGMRLANPSAALSAARWPRNAPQHPGGGVMHSSGGVRRRRCAGLIGPAPTRLLEQLRRIHQQTVQTADGQRLTRLCHHFADTGFTRAVTPCQH